MKYKKYMKKHLKLNILEAERQQWGKLKIFVKAHLQIVDISRCRNVVVADVQLQKGPDPLNSM